MKKLYKIISMALLFGLAACTDLDVKPKSSASADVVFTDPAAYKQFLAKVYAGLAIGGQGSGDDNTDISGINGGFSQYIRQYYNAQELPTDEAVIGWNDGTIQTYHFHTWTSQSEFLNAMFNRIYFQISMANEFLRQTTDELVSSRGATDELKAEIKKYRAEVRFLRALSYWHGLDMFGSVPIVPETTPIGTDAPGQPEGGKQDVFNLIESELIDINDDLSDPKTVEYPRVDKAAAWMLLAKLYLNAEVYLGSGTVKYTESLTYLNKILQVSSYNLEPVYQNLFKADNHRSQEIIFAVAFDGTHTQTYGGTTFLCHAAIGGNMSANDYGVSSGWAGLRTTSNIVDLFPVSGDNRSMFYTNGQSKDIINTPNTSFNEGYAIPKFQNVTSEGAPGSNSNFADTDFPVFRLADTYLMYAEAVLRGGAGGDAATALSYVNELRARAYGNASGNITAPQLDLDFIIDERGRELYWECHRRTDLVRFDLFTTSPTDDVRAVWPWKGNEVAGKQTETFRNVFPIPSAALIANTKLKQNEGY
ncbi:MAG: RagB/SusD family nutrient uptake outer membrane protein [Chryseolinea sp.]